MFRPDTDPSIRDPFYANSISKPHICGQPSHMIFPVIRSTHSDSDEQKAQLILPSIERTHKSFYGTIFIKYGIPTGKKEGKIIQRIE